MKFKNLAKWVGSSILVVAILVALYIPSPKIFMENLLILVLIVAMIPVSFGLIFVCDKIEKRFHLDEWVEEHL